MIGLKRGIVKLVPYNPEWAELFEEEKLLLTKTFRSTLIAVEHVGSTSIPGIPAKPIIDINLGVTSLEIARAMKEKFESIGYQHRPFTSGKRSEELKYQELYVKGSDFFRTHHVHVTVFDNQYWRNGIVFRDYLRKNSEHAKQYADLKEKLAAKYPNDRESYTANKDKFIKKILSGCNI